MLTPTQALLVVRTPGIGGNLVGAMQELHGLLAHYDNARIISLATYPIKNPLGAGDIAVEVVAAIEHEGVIGT